MWKICNSGATFRATLLEISRNKLKYKGNKSPFLKEINEWEVVKSLKNASQQVLLLLIYKDVNIMIK